MRVATWNVEWAPTASHRAARVSALLADLNCEVLVITEGSAVVLPSGGHFVDAGGLWGYGCEPTRRKVLAWSRQPWRDVRRVEGGAGRGRVIAGTTDTSIGPVVVAAVCIPWRECHVRTGRRDASLWSEHVECCTQIGELLHGVHFELPLITMGDFNQRLPRHRQPEHVEAALTQALRGQTVWTRGETAVGRLIDHIASSIHLTGSDLEVWPGSDGSARLTDHPGVAVRFDLRP